MIYAGIDVNIITHEKAEAAGPEAFGLWCWAMCWAQVHESDGRVPRIVALRALGGRRNVMLAKRLVDVGLWSDNDDGSWTIRNYAKKNQTKEEIQQRKEAARQRKEDWKVRQNEKRNANGTRSGTREEHVPERPLPPTPSLPASPAPSDQIPLLAPQGADEVWAHYVAVAKIHRPRRRKTELSAKDRKAVNAHLRSGLTVEDLKRACDGLFRSPHHLGVNPGNTEWLDFEYALRKPASMIALADDMVPVIEPIRPAATPPEEYVDPAEVDAALANLDSLFDSKKAAS